MTTTSPADTANYWTLQQKIALRFFFIFFVIFILFDPNGVSPSADLLGKYYGPVLDSIVIWVAKHILGINAPLNMAPTGSGDTTCAYVWMFIITFASFVGTIIWSVTGRKTQNYRKFYFWIWVALRYYVAFTMLAYGSFKVIKLQFPNPSPARLLEPVGNMSPMGLAWTYMGHSIGFNWFTGLGEITCGLLLLFRRTTTLGAIIGLAVAGNIMAINYAYDVPVKILATVLVCMCLFILFKDYNRLVNFFFRNREAQPSNITPPRFRAKWKNIVLCVAKYGLIGYFVISLCIGVFKQNKQFGDDAPKPKFYGIYNVKYFVRKHDTLPPLTTDTIRWNKLCSGNFGRTTIEMMNDSMVNYNIRTDTIKHQLQFITSSGKDSVTLAYKALKPDTLLVSGLWFKDSIKVKLVKYDMKKFRLNSRGFHWVNEFPYNK